MCIDEEHLEMYLNRMMKRNSEQLISQKMKKLYKSNIVQLRKSGALINLFDADIMKSHVDESTLDNQSKAIRMMSLSRLLSVMNEEDIRRHFPNETDLSFTRLNSLIQRYRRLCTEYRKNDTHAAVVQI